MLNESKRDGIYEALHDLTREFQKSLNEEQRVWLDGLFWRFATTESIDGFITNQSTLTTSEKGPETNSGGCCK